MQCNMSQTKTADLFCPLPALPTLCICTQRVLRLSAYVEILQGPLPVPSLGLFHAQESFCDT